MMHLMQSPVSFKDALGHGMADKRIDILRQIGQGGSISQAARAVGVSYKAAWQALDTLTNLAGVALVERVVGGVGGGGARLTPAGRQLLATADAVQQARSAVLVGLGEGGDADAAVARLSVRTSMRNQWPCTVQAMESRGQIVRVHLRGAVGAVAGLAVCSRITRESAELLGLRPGLPVQALCKATAVHVLPLAAAGAAQDGNRWPGRAVRVSRGELGDEVAAQLDAGVQMVGFAAAGSGLRARSRVVLAAEESAIVLAVV
ncbi:TOBE domain-containing protein [Alicycliphilus denitrificans]|uniref:Putative transcriptional regulator, ModE family n=1 Tax=Alicycliphilus denitrificans (strain DSM 14773 / CIP 107495 / K601) TaxID=596154 RepID=F4GCI2_ALIDK|nr:TOBE domain-containing protein [Alicycliphilus denitrificans]AEB85914.1 putative transcriptional regulator, ModE family [Alicycliphilus denitrificans K601]